MTQTSTAEPKQSHILQGTQRERNCNFVWLIMLKETCMTQHLLLQCGLQTQTKDSSIICDANIQNVPRVTGTNLNPHILHLKINRLHPVLFKKKKKAAGILWEAGSGAAPTASSECYSIKPSQNTDTSSPRRHSGRQLLRPALFNEAAF